MTHASLPNRVFSLSNNSLASLLPNFYSLGTNYSVPSVRVNGEEPEEVSDQLARESDVTVSTNVTPQAEYKGFATYVISAMFLALWLAWSLLPDKILHDLGIHYYPSRWWALAIPSYVLVAMIYTYVALTLYNVEVETVPLDDMRTLTDKSGVLVTQPEVHCAAAANLTYFTNHATSGIWDLPITTVNEVLYGEGVDDPQNAVDN